MTEKNLREQMSALLDDELDDSELHDTIRKLRSDQQSKECWQNYSLIGDALRQNLSDKPDVQLLSRINQCLEAEPTIIPQTVSKPSVEKKPASNVISWVMKPVSGFAVAASVAIVAYIGVGVLAVDGGSDVRMAQVSPSVPAIVVADQVNSAPAWGMATTVSSDAYLDRYISNHQAVSVAAGMSGQMLPHIRIIADRGVK